MPFFAAQTPAIPASRTLSGAAKLIADEGQWRSRPPPPGQVSARPRVTATRWRNLENSIREVSAETADDCHVVAIILRTMNSWFSVSGRCVHDGIAPVGLLHVTNPAVSSRGIFRGPYDSLHLYIPNTVIAECGQDLPSKEAAALRLEPILARDPVVERLGRALLGADGAGETFGPLFADYVGLAIVARLLASECFVRTSMRAKSQGLGKERLKRAIDYIEAHLAEPISLADIAAVVGLSRMHFAAQFKTATGLRPHEYLLRRRIERAQALLTMGNLSLVDIALSVGFQSQSHFTDVFKRFVGQPPQAWRHSQR